MKYTVMAIVDVDEDNAKDAEVAAKKLISSGEFAVIVQLECTLCGTTLHVDADECYKCWTPIKHTPKEKS